MLSLGSVLFLFTGKVPEGKNIKKPYSRGVRS